MKRRPGIAACVIVRDGAQTIERLLASVRPHVDEVCILDTGSTDATLELLDEIGRTPGAPIVVARDEWRDDYAAARNRSFALASTEYLAWFDDDDVLEGGETLREQLEQVDALYVRRVNVWSRELVSAGMRLRVVRADVGARWESRIHERLRIPADLRRGIADPTRLRVIHAPVPQPGRHDHRPLVEAELAREPTRHLRFYLARHLLLDDQDAAAAAPVFEAVVDRDDPWQLDDLPEIADAYRYLAAARYELGDRAGAQDAFRRSTEVVCAQLLDPMFREGRQLDLAHPIDVDDPLWAMYADDPRLQPAEAAYT